MQARGCGIQVQHHSMQARGCGIQVQHHSMQNLKSLAYHMQSFLIVIDFIAKFSLFLLGDTSGAGTAYPSGAPEFTPSF
jgi:hypothetical protein